MREAWKNASRSDKVVGLGGPIVGLVALVAGLATSEMTTAVFGAVAVATGLLFAIPFVRAGGRPAERERHPDDR
jgi:hypothetical protein